MQVSLFIHKKSRTADIVTLLMYSVATLKAYSRGIHDTWTNIWNIQTVTLFS